MKSPLILWIALFLLTVFVVFQAFTLDQVRSELQTLKSTDIAEPPHAELAEYMGSLQQFMNKMWFAGSAGNTELAKFYHHEVEEVLEELIEENIEDEGHAVSDLARTMLLPAVEELETAIASADSATFRGAYLGIVNACNACHQVTEHAMIVITLPNLPFIDNQSFAKLPAGASL
jgi:hypothetical protein